jgi:predicted PurR-regulated permease PerM
MADEGDFRPTARIAAAPLARRMWRDPVGALTLIAIVASLGLLYWGRPFFIPVVASITLAAVLDPVRRRLSLVLHSNALASLLAVVVTLTVVLASGSAVVRQLAGTTERWPTVLRLAARDIGKLAEPGTAAGTMKHTRQALAELDRSVAKVTGDVTAAPPAVAKPSMVTDAAGWVRTQLVNSTLTTLSVLLQVGVITLMTFFLMCSGEGLVRRVCAWADDRHPAASKAQAAAFEMARQVRLYGGVIVLTNAVLGLGVAGGFALFGVPDPWSWGLVAAALHFIPYAGMAVMMALTAVEVYAAQSSLAMALLAAGYVGLLGVVVGTAMTAWLQGRAAKVDSALLFIGTVFWSVWWGGWGLVLGPVIVVALRIAVLYQKALPESAPADAATSGQVVEEPRPA